MACFWKACNVGVCRLQGCLTGCIEALCSLPKGCRPHLHALQQPGGLCAQLRHLGEGSAAALCQRLALSLAQAQARLCSTRGADVCKLLLSPSGSNVSESV